MFEIFREYIESRISLTEEQYWRLQSLCSIKKLRKKQYLLQEGDAWKYHAFITKGCMRTYSIVEKGLEHIIFRDRKLVDRRQGKPDV